MTRPPTAQPVELSDDRVYEFECEMIDLTGLPAEAYGRGDEAVSPRPSTAGPAQSPAPAPEPPAPKSV